jgi:tetratricopeptide (TPR) repeat protein
VGLTILSGSSVLYLMNNEYCNHSKDTLPSDIALNILNNCQGKSILILEDWDIYAPILYFQHVNSLRPDVIVIDKELLRRSWYFEYLKNYSPELMSGVSNEREQFYSQLLLFEANKPYNPQKIQTTYEKLIKSFISFGVENNRNVYIKIRSDLNIIKDFHLEPMPGVNKIVSGVDLKKGTSTDVSVLSGYLNKPFRLLSKRKDSRYISNQIDYLKTASLYFLSMNKYERARDCIDYCLFLLSGNKKHNDPFINDYSDLLTDKALIELSEGNVKKAVSILKDALRYPHSTRAIRILRTLKSQNVKTGNISR